MKIDRLISLVIAGVLVLPLAAQSPDQKDQKPAEALPSAPSAVVAPKPDPPPPPQQTAKPQAKPVETGPVLKPLVPKRPSTDQPKTEEVSTPTDPLKPATPDKSPTPPNADAPANDDENITKIVARVEEVNVIFTVSDKRGRFIKDLRQDDFKVLDDKRLPEAIRKFDAETNLPLRVGLLVDASSSVRNQFMFEQEAAIEFLNQIIRPKVDRAFVVGFDATFEVTQDVTNETDKLSAGIRMIRPGGGTAMFDAIYRACKEKLMTTGDTTTVRRAIILLSDGDDNQSRATREEAIDMAQRAGVIIYAISTDLTPSKSNGDKVMERIAEATGGRAFFPFKIQDVADAFADIQDELRSQYVLSYKPAGFLADGRFRTIDIETPNNKKLRIRARKGYYAPKQ